MAEQSKDLAVKGAILDLLRRTNREGIEELIDYLEKSDFFTAPASTKFHGSYAGGLAEHSLNVYNTLEFLYDSLQYVEFNTPEIPEDSRIIVALCHDLCKINTYHDDFRWTKDDNNQWVQVPQYKKDPLLPMGHGAKSVFILQQFISLSVPEALAIFWHMGAYDTSLYMTMNELGKAYEENLLAFLLHQADMFCTYVNENACYQ